MNTLRRVFIGAALAVLGLQSAGATPETPPAEKKTETAPAATNTDFLKGLKKFAPEDATPGQEMQLDFNSTPVYTPQGERITDPMKLIMMLRSGEQTLDVYVDDKKQVKACVMRPATEAERAQMKVQEDSSGPLIVENGAPAKPFTVTDMAGNTHSLDSLKGKVVVMNFWFISCEPCVMEIPDLNKLVQKYRNREVVFLALARDDKARLTPFLEKNAFNYQVVPDSGALIRQFGVAGFPSHVIIDRNSKIAFQSSGLQLSASGSPSIEQLDKAIDRLAVIRP